MAVMRSDIIVPSIFTPYVIDETTKRDAFLQSGVVQPMAELNATEGGDFIQMPAWNADFATSVNFEPLSETKSLTPQKLGTNKQNAVIVHRGNAFEARDLARLAAGSDPMAAIGQKLAAYIANERQLDLLNLLNGVFGPDFTNNSNGGNVACLRGLTIDNAQNSSPQPLTPRHVAKAKSLLGDQGEKLTAIAMHSAVYYDLVQQRAIDFVYTAEGTPATNLATGGSNANAFGGETAVPTYMGLRVIVSDDIAKNNGYHAVYFFAQGAIASGEQMGLNIEQDRDILAKSDALSFDLHYVYHVKGTSWNKNRLSTGYANPDRSGLHDVSNWEFDTEFKKQNVGIVRAIVTSTMD